MARLLLPTGVAFACRHIFARSTTFTCACADARCRIASCRLRAQIVRRRQPAQPHGPAAAAACEPQSALENLNDEHRQSLGSWEIDLHAFVALPLATALGRGAGAAASKAGHPQAVCSRRADADHPRDYRRARHDRRRHEPRPRVRRRRRRGTRALPREDRGPEGCRRHADDAGGRAGFRHRRLRPCGVRDRVSHGRALGDRVVRAERAQAVHPRDQGEGSGASCSPGSKRCCAAAA